MASKHGQAKAEQEQAAQQQVRPTPRRSPPAQAEAPAPPVASSEDSYGELMKLKELLDAGVLTQQEFDTQKTNILAR
jgi:hypothetical protein